MTCRDVTDALHDYLSGELPAEQMAEIDRHIGGCADCTNYLDAYKRTQDLAKDALEADPMTPAELPDALLEAILRARRPN